MAYLGTPSAQKTQDYDVSQKSKSHAGRLTGALTESMRN
jgi:hypothetical protein